MKLKKVLACLIVGTLVASVPVGVLAKDYYVSQEQGVQGIIDAIYDETNEDGVYTITLESGEYDFGAEGQEALNLQGKTYEINGTDITLSDVQIGGSGTITIKAKIANRENTDALNVGSGEGEELNVTVEGDVEAVDRIEQTDENGDPIVNEETGGQIVAANGVSVYSDGTANVTVNGDVFAATNGVNAGGNGTVTVNGNVTGEEGTVINADGSSSVTVNGDIDTYVGDGVREAGSASVSISGNIIADGTTGGYDDTYSVGAYVSGAASLTVGGNVSSSAEGIIASGGTVTVEGNVTAGDASNEDNWALGVYATFGEDGDDSPNITVKGDVSTVRGDAVVGDTGSITIGGDVTSGGTAVVSRGDSTITVEGDITAGDAEDPDNWSNGVIADYQYEQVLDEDGNPVKDEDGNDMNVQVEGSAPTGTVTVNGNVTATGDAVTGKGTSTIKVTGDVDSRDADGVYALDGSNIEINGNVISGDQGVNAFGESNVMVTGDVSGDWAAVYTEGQSTVTIVGDVSGNNTENEDEQAGHGLYVLDSSTVKVDGNVAGGDGVTLSGYGIVMTSTATVDVTGDVSGGDANSTEWAKAYDGAKIYMMEDGEAGSLTAGSVTGGSIVADEDESGVGIWFTTDNPYNYDLGDNGLDTYLYTYDIADDVYSDDLYYLTFGVSAYIEDMHSEQLEDAQAIIADYITAKNAILNEAQTQLGDTLSVYEAQVFDDVISGTETYQTVQAMTMTNLYEEYQSLLEKLEGVTNEDGETVFEQLEAALNETRDELEALCPFADVNDLVYPNITVASIVGGAGMDAYGSDDDEITALMESKITYAVQTEAENGTIEGLKESYQPGDTVEFKVAVNDGYELSGVTVTTADGTKTLEYTEKDGVYTVVMPEDSTGMLVKAEFTAVEKPADSDDDANSENPKSDDTKTDNAATDDTKTDNAATNDTKTDNAATNDTKTDDAATDDTKTDNAKSDGTKTGSPKTADGQMAGLWIALGGVAGAAAIAASKKKKNA